MNGARHPRLNFVQLHFGGGESWENFISERRRGGEGLSFDQWPCVMLIIYFSTEIQKVRRKKTSAITTYFYFLTISTRENFLLDSPPISSQTLLWNYWMKSHRPIKAANRRLEKIVSGVLFQTILFLVVDKRLYTLPCRLVGRSVGRSVTFLNSESNDYYHNEKTMPDTQLVELCAGR